MSQTERAGRRVRCDVPTNPEIRGSHRAPSGASCGSVPDVFVLQLDQFVVTVRQSAILRKQVAHQLQIVELLGHYGRTTVAARKALARLQRTHRFNSARRSRLGMLLEDKTGSTSMVSH